MTFTSTLARPLAGILAAVLAAGSAAAEGPGDAPSRVQAAGSVVQLSSGRGRLVTLPRPMSDLFIADDGVADVQVRSPTQLYVFGKKPGETTISATARNGQVVWASTVRVGTNFDSVGQMLSVAMPDAQITATTMNGLVLLTGTVAQPADAAEAERLVQAFVGDGARVLSRLKTATPLQVNLQVRIVEVTRSFSKQVGINLQSFDGTGGFRFGISRGTAASQFARAGTGLYAGGTSPPTGTSLVTPTVGTALAGAGRLLGLDLLGSLDLGEVTGQVTTLANPNLTALSGETGTFLAGGEIPIPLAQALGTVSVEFKQYGVSLSYTPTVLSDGRISLRVRPEVSQLDYSNAVTLNGTRVPGLTTRRAETTLELGSGQSMMIGGLLQNGHNNNLDKTPFLGDIPILGALFRSNSFQRSETELVIVITPYLVKPVNDQRDIHYPTDGYRAPTDTGRVFLGQLASGVSGDRRAVPVLADPAGPPPAIGAVAPVGPAPSPARAPKRGKGDAAPGFSN